MYFFIVAFAMLGLGVTGGYLVHKSTHLTCQWPSFYLEALGLALVLSSLLAFFYLVQ